VSSPLLSHTPHRRRTGGSRGATQRGVRLDLGGISKLTLWRQRWTLVRFIFIFYFVRLPLCNKYSDDIVTFISIHYVIICVVFFGVYMRCTRLCPLNLGVTASKKPKHGGFKIEFEKQGQMVLSPLNIEDTRILRSLAFMDTIICLLGQLGYQSQ
jgi:hypothetical protein